MSDMAGMQRTLSKTVEKGLAFAQTKQQAVERFARVVEAAKKTKVKLDSETVRRSPKG